MRLIGQRVGCSYLTALNSIKPSFKDGWLVLCGLPKGHMVGVSVVVRPLPIAPKLPKLTDISFGPSCVEQRQASWRPLLQKARTIGMPRRYTTWAICLEMRVAMRTPVAMDITKDLLHSFMSDYHGMVLQVLHTRAA